jgi:hypothetical protein
MSSLVLPLPISVYVTLFGFAFFATVGAYLGMKEEYYKADMRRQVYRAFEKSATKEELDYWAAKAYERLEMFHGHGFLVVLAMFLVSFLIANSNAESAVKQVLTWGASLSGFGYSLGWFFAGYYVPKKGFREAKAFAIRYFFLPFGSIMVVILWAVFFLWVFNPPSF